MTTLAWLLGAWALLALLERAVRKRRGPEWGAKALQEYAPADLADYRHLDQRFYERVTREAEQLGFVLTGEMENKTVSRLGVGLPAVIRCLSDRKGISIALYNFKGRGWQTWINRQHRNVCAIEVCTELSDGSFVTTSNSWGARHMKLPAKENAVDSQ